MLEHITASPFFTGILTIFSTFGNQFLQKDVHALAQAVFRHKLARHMVLFAMLFISTKSLLISTTLTMLFAASEVYYTTANGLGGSHRIERGTQTIWPRGPPREVDLPRGNPPFLKLGWDTSAAMAPRQPRAPPRLPTAPPRLPTAPPRLPTAPPRLPTAPPRWNRDGR